MIVRIKTRLTDLATSKSLSARAIQSSAWVVIGFAGQRGLQFLSNLILTRLLFPEAFGIMALATVFLVGLAMFSDIGLKPAIIRDPRSRDPNFLNTAWTIQVVRGLGLCGAGCSLAYPVSIIYGEPILFPLLIVVSLTAAISGFQTIELATSERDLDFFRPTLVALAGRVIGIITVISLACYWRSVWALAVGNVVGSALTVFIGHRVLRTHRHRFRVDREALRSIVRFGRWIMLSTIVTFASGEGLRAVQGGLLTLAEFGVLSIAYTVAVIATELPIKIAGVVGLPTLAEAFRSGRQRLVQVVSKMRKRIMLSTLPIVVFVIFISDPIIKLLYDERYHDAGDFVALVTASNAIAVIYSGYCSALLAMGRSLSHLLITLFTAVSRITGLIVGFAVYGIPGMLLGIGLANVATLIFCWATPSVRPLASQWLDVLAVVAIVAPLFVII